MRGLGVIGCGNISGIYLKNLTASDAVRVVGVADLDEEAARRSADSFGTQAMSVDELLSHPEVEIVVNLTTPQSHYAIAEAALRAGKNVYNEKPLTLTLDESRTLLALAEERGRQVGCAPDTILGAGIQTSRRLIDEGRVGRIVGGHAAMMCRGHEGWHPSPEFYYRKGGGPLFDMGPYYLSALVALVGPVRRVVGLASTPKAERVIGSEPKRGQVITVETPTHIVAILEFAQGALVSLTMSFDVQSHTLPPIELYGENATLQVPDPNGFGGEVLLRTGGNEESIGLAGGPVENARGIGVIDLAESLGAGRAPRASGQLGAHVVEIMEGVLRSAASGSPITLDTSSLGGDLVHRRA